MFIFIHKEVQVLATCGLKRQTCLERGIWMGMWSGGQSISIFISHDKARWSIPAREVNRSNAPVMLISLYHPLLDFQKGLLGVEITRPATGPTSRPNDVWPPLT